MNSHADPAKQHINNSESITTSENIFCSLELKEESIKRKIKTIFSLIELKDANNETNPLLRKQEIKNEEKKSLDEPSWEDLDILVPNFLLAPCDYEEKSQAAGLYQIFLDCFRNHDRILFNNMPIPLPNKNLLISNPDINIIEAVLAGQEELLPQKEKYQIEYIKTVCQFLKKQLTEAGMIRILKIYDQAEIGIYQFILREMMNHHNIALRTPNFRVEIDFSLDEGLIFKSISNNIKCMYISKPEETCDYFAKDIVIGTKLIVKPNGEISREFYTSSINQKVFNELCDFYFNKLGVHKEKSQSGDFKFFSSESRSFTSECKSLKKEIEENESLRKILMHIDNIESLIEDSIYIRLKTASAVSSLQKKLDKMINNIKERQQYARQGREEEEVEDLLQANILLQAEVIAISTYSGLIRGLNNTPVDDFIVMIRDQMQQMEERLDRFANQLDRWTLIRTIR